MVVLCGDVRFVRWAHLLLTHIGPHGEVAARNPYQLRHTFASQHLSQGENIAYIAKLLGHKER